MASSNSTSLKTHFHTRASQENQDICEGWPDHLLLWTMSDTQSRNVFLATVTIFSKLGIRLEGVEGGSTFVYLHIPSQGSPGRLCAPSIQPALGSLPYNTALLQPGGPENHRQGSFVCFQSHSGHTFLHVTPGLLHGTRASLRNPQQHILINTS